MRKGFTMIELIFVIVILGILAAVAVPRLTATRDDAEIAKAATNVSTLISDIGAYYTSQGRFGTKAQMSNVVISGGTDLTILPNGTANGTATGTLQSAGKNCLAFTLTPEVNNATTRTPAFVTIAAGADAAAPICVKVIADPEIQKYMNAQFVGQTFNTGTNQWEAAPAANGVQITGLSVVR